MCVTVWKTDLRLAYGWSGSTLRRKIIELRPMFLEIDTPGYVYEPRINHFKKDELEIIYRLYGKPLNFDPAKQGK